MCSTSGLNSNAVIFTQKQANDLIAAAATTGGKFGGRPGSSKEPPTFAVASGPSGGPMMIVLAADAAGGAGFYTEAASYQIAGEFEKSGNDVTAKVGVFKKGALVRELTWTLDVGGPNAISKAAVLTKLKVDDKEGVHPLSCFEDCLRRHAGQCAALCDWLGWGSQACWACAAATAACCAINCNC